MRLGLISKYPPIQGGVSSSVYWTAKGLGESGVEVSVITDSLSVDFNDRIVIDPDELYQLQPENVSLYSTNPFVSLMPVRGGKKGGSESQLFALSLEAMKKEPVDLWYSHYFLPYGVVAWCASQKTKKPFILRHAGSDFSRVQTGSFVNLLDIVNDASFFISSHPIAKNMVSEEKVVSMKCGIRPEFNPDAEPLFNSETFIIGVLGKYHSSKRIKELFTALNEINKDYRLVFLCNNSDKEKIFSLNPNISRKISFLGYIPPWKMPNFYTSLDCLFYGEQGFPIEHHFPIIPAEAMCCGIPVLLSQEVFSKYKHILPRLDNLKHCLTVDSQNPNDIKEKLELLINDPSVKEYINKRASESKIRGNHEEYISQLINLSKRSINI